MKYILISLSFLIISGLALATKQSDFTVAGKCNWENGAGNNEGEIHAGDAVSYLVFNAGEFNGDWMDPRLEKPDNHILFIRSELAKVIDTLESSFLPSPDGLHPAWITAYQGRPTYVNWRENGATYGFAGGDPGKIFASTNGHGPLSFNGYPWCYLRY